MRWSAVVAALAAASALSGCGTSEDAPDAEAAGLVQATIRTAAGAQVFRVELADTADEQERGLMHRTDLRPDGGMLFAPYPPDGGGPREAAFWMKNTPSPLDILFIRADGTIARVAENAVPFSEAPVPSLEPVAAVLEIPGGRAAELGIAEDDRVSWSASPGRAAVEGRAQAG